jgi:hypothetical protein
MTNQEIAKRQALDLLTHLTSKFDGLLEVEKDVNGADLINELTYGLHRASTLLKYLKGEL